MTRRNSGRIGAARRDKERTSHGYCLGNGRWLTATDSNLSVHHLKKRNRKRKRKESQKRRRRRRRVGRLAAGSRLQTGVETCVRNGVDPHLTYVTDVFLKSFKAPFFAPRSVKVINYALVFNFSRRAPKRLAKISLRAAANRIRPGAPSPALCSY